MVANGKFKVACLRAGPIVGVLLPLVLILLLLPESTDSQMEDYLPSSRARTVTLTIIKSLKPFQGESAGTSSHVFAVGGVPPCAAVHLASIGADLHLHLRHFAFLSNRLVRSPPTNSL